MNNGNQSRLYARFLAVEHARETAMDCPSPSRVACDEVLVAQFCRAKDHEIINDGAECEWSENVMQFLHHYQLDTSKPPRSQSLGWCIAGQ